MQLSLIAWIKNNDQPEQLSLLDWIENTDQTEQLSLIDWIEAEQVAEAVERKLFQRETKQCFACLEVFPIESIYCDEMGWPTCIECNT